MTMENVNFYEPPKGGRISSAKFRASLQKAEEFSGLNENVSRFHALKLIKQAGKIAGFRPELVELLEYYLVRTQDIDWTKDNQPICYQTVTATAQDLGISERQVWNREKALHTLGALTWNDSGNQKRYGQRDKETGAIKYAFGVDLSPLAALLPALERAIEQKKILQQLRDDEKRKITGLRAKIRALLNEAGQYDELQDFVETITAEYKNISHSIRSYHSLEEMKTLKEQHQLMVSALLETLEDVVSAANSNGGSVDNNVDVYVYNTSMDATDFRHIHSTTLKLSDKSDYSSPEDSSLQEGVAASSETKSQDLSNPKIEKDVEPTGAITGAERITAKQVLNASSERFREHIPLTARAIDFSDLVEAAAALLPVLKINKTAWWDACGVMGRYSAAICVMVIDQKSQNPDTPIKNPGGYFRAMTKRAKAGELNLQNSVFGLLKRDEEKHDA